MTRRALTFRLSQVVVVFTMAVLMLGADSSDSRFERLGHMLICQCGDNNVLLECPHINCPSAPQMKAELRAQMASGASDKQVLTWFAAKYGPTVLAAPIRGGFDDVAWIVPIALFVLATIGTGVLVFYWKRRTAFIAGPEALLSAEEAATRFDPVRDRIRRETEGL